MAENLWPAPFVNKYAIAFSKTRSRLDRIVIVDNQYFHFYIVQVTIRSIGHSWQSDYIEPSFHLRLNENVYILSEHRVALTKLHWSYQLQFHK